MNPAWSPDGEFLYFASDRAGTMNVWRIRIDEQSGKTTGDPEPLSTPSLFSFMPTVAKDGRRIAYLQQSRTSNLHVLAFNPVTQAVTAESPVTQGARMAWTPDLSPDGEWLVWASRGREDLFLVRPDGSGHRQLTDDRFSDRAPRWAPDGKLIAFYSDRTGKYEIWTIRPDGSGAQQLTDTKEPLTYVVWSPDGKRIASAGSGGVVIYNALNGRVSQPVETTPAVHEKLGTWPWSWSPDGKLLAASPRTQASVGIFSAP
jgi:Tol biopolymer transport system component